MLLQLRVSGLALLEEATLDFPPGLCAITGETGAGKTMILTSLRLLTGQKADPSLVAAGQARTEVDGVFHVDEQIAQDLEAAGYTVEDGEAFFSRTVAAEGRSRAWIGGRPVPARLLAETLGPLVTIHGQTDQFRLRSGSAQLDLLDTYAGNADLRRDYESQWQEVTDLRRRLLELERDAGQRAVEQRYLQETIAAAEELDLSPNEEEILDAQIERLTNVEDLRAASGRAVMLLREDPQANALELLGATAETLRRASQLDSALGDLAERLTTLIIEAEALAADLADYTELQVDDPDELGRLHSRRAAMTDLMRGRAASAAELLDWLLEAKERLALLESDALDPAALKEKLGARERDLREAANLLTDSRRTAAGSLGAQVTAELEALALGDAVFSVEVASTDLGPHGADAVTMLLQPHPDAPARPIGRGASGGEMSRIMLALEVVLAANDGGRTFVFDEIDAGIGGTTVAAVGDRLKRLAADQQVIVVTHQPQIAALADRNYVVTKHNGQARVQEVTGEARTAEIVRMLGGEGDTDAARRHALELEARGRMAQSTL